MTIALFGSGEFLPWATDVDRACVDGHASDRVLILPTASAQEGDATFERWGTMGLAHYRSLGYRPEVLPVRTRADAQDPAIAERVTGAALVYFSGGDPGYLAETLRDTVLWRAILSALDDGTSYGGCSAGASAVGMRTFTVEGEALGRWVDGLDLLPGTFILPHFDQLDSYAPGLRAQMLSLRPAGATVIGIDENTVLLADGDDVRVVGSGAVWIGSGADDLVASRAGDAPNLRLPIP